MLGGEHLVEEGSASGKSGAATSTGQHCARGAKPSGGRGGINGGKEAAVRTSPTRNRRKATYWMDLPYLLRTSAQFKARVDRVPLARRRHGNTEHSRNSSQTRDRPELLGHNLERAAGLARVEHGLLLRKCQRTAQQVRFRTLVHGSVPTRLGHAQTRSWRPSPSLQARGGRRLPVLGACSIRVSGEMSGTSTAPHLTT